ncbi:MAG: macrolide family glycosyltransferase [Chloroflexota bacterium]
MAKIAYVGLPAHGHTNPTLPVVKGLIEQGHEVLYYNGEDFREKLKPTGVDFRPLPEPLPSSREVSEALHEFINAPLLLSRISEPLAHFLIDAFAVEKPDLVLYDSTAMWGYIAARTHNIPQICLITTFVLDGSQGAIGWGTMAGLLWSALPYAPKLLRWRRHMAVTFGPENSGGITEFADNNIVFTSKAFHPENQYIDQRFHFVGPSIDATTRDGVLTPDLQAALDASKTVFISLGTINHMDLPFYQAAFEAFADYPARFILAAGKNSDPAALGPIPDNFVVKPYVPQLDVLRRADAFITHGGMNSVHEGLYYGVPLIVVPHQFEQLLNGKQVAKTGAGVLLGDKRPYGRVTSAELRAALEVILDQPVYHQKAAEIGETLRQAGGYARAIDIILATAAGKAYALA